MGLGKSMCSDLSEYQFLCNVESNIIGDVLASLHFLYNKHF
jgi:hypothetical protein